MSENNNKNRIERRDTFEALKNSNAQTFLQQIKNDNSKNNNQGSNKNNK